MILLISVVIIVVCIVLSIYSKINKAKKIYDIFNNKENIIEDTKSAIDNAKAMYNEAKQDLENKKNN